MPQTPNFSLRYPLEGSAVNNTDFTNLATDLDAALTLINTLKESVRKPPAVLARRQNSAQALAVATDTTMQFDTVDFDTAGFANLAVSTTNLTIPSDGIYQSVAFQSAAISGYTTITSYRVTVLIAGVPGPEKKYWDSFGTTAKGPFKATAGQVVTLRERWTGTGGPANFNYFYLALFKICNL
jgi:hypothetical protein